MTGQQVESKKQIKHKSLEESNKKYG